MWDDQFGYYESTTLVSCPTLAQATICAVSSHTTPHPTSLTMSNPPNAVAATSPEHFQSILSQDLQRVSLINFWAPWAAPCAQMNEVVLELAKRYPQLLVVSVRCSVDAGNLTDSCMTRWTQSSRRIFRSHSMSSQYRPSSSYKCVWAVFCVINFQLTHYIN